jgi:hypothetical protein
VALEFEKDKTDAILVIRDHESKVQRFVSRLKVMNLKRVGDSGLAFVDAASQCSYQTKFAAADDAAKIIFEAWDYVQTCDDERQVWQMCDHQDQSELFVTGECRLLFIPKKGDQLVDFEFGAMTVKDSFKFEFNTQPKMFIGWIMELIEVDLEPESTAFYGALLNDSRQSITWGLFIATFYYKQSARNLANKLSSAEFHPQPLDLCKFLNYRDLCTEPVVPDYTTPFEHDLELQEIFTEPEPEKKTLSGCGTEYDIVNEPFELEKLDRLLTFGLFD